MAEIRRDTEYLPHRRYGSVYDDHVEFESGKRVTEVDDEIASWAVETWDELEYTRPQDKDDQDESESVCGYEDTTTGEPCSNTVPDPDEYCSTHQE